MPSRYPDFWSVFPIVRQKEKVSPGRMTSPFTFSQARRMLVTLFSCSVRSTPCSRRTSTEECRLTTFGSASACFSFAMRSLDTASRTLRRKISFFMEIQ